MIWRTWQTYISSFVRKLLLPNYFLTKSAHINLITLLIIQHLSVTMTYLLSTLGEPSRWFYGKIFQTGIYQTVCRGVESGFQTEHSSIIKVRLTTFIFDNKNNKKKNNGRVAHIEFWLQQPISQLYSGFGQAIQALSSFYLCEGKFSPLTMFLTKKWNQLLVTKLGDLQLFWFEFKSEINKLVKMQ